MRWYPPRVRFEITESDLSSYRAAADFLNSNDVDVVSLQHEYGIFGGKAGSHVLRLLQRLKMPVVTTLHTVLREPDLDQLVVMQEIAARSDRLIVMSEYSSQFLQDVFSVPSRKIDLIPHGIPDLPFAEPASYKDSFSTGKSVLLTFGLLSPNKGFENVIQALPNILSRHSNVVYIIAGATHPHVRRREGDRYRLQLQALAKELGVGEKVVLYNRFVSPQEMAALIGSADIYVTPYRYEAQAVSGTLAYALGAPARQSSRLRTGTPPNCWTMGAGLWSPSRTQPPSRIRRLNSWTTMQPARRCVDELTSMHAIWCGTR